MRASSRNDMTCPLCMYVVSKVKEQLSDPLTRQAIHDKTTAACGVLPQGSMRDTCTQWSNQYGENVQLYLLHQFLRCVFAYVYVCVRMHAGTHACVYDVCVCVRARVCMSVHASCMHACVCVRACNCVCMHTKHV